MTFFSGGASQISILFTMVFPPLERIDIIRGIYKIPVRCHILNLHLPAANLCFISQILISVQHGTFVAINQIHQTIPLFLGRYLILFTYFIIFLCRVLIQFFPSILSVARARITAQIDREI